MSAEKEEEKLYYNKIDVCEAKPNEPTKKCGNKENVSSSVSFYFQLLSHIRFKRTAYNTHIHSHQNFSIGTNKFNIVSKKKKK